MDFQKALRVLNRFSILMTIMYLSFLSSAYAQTWNSIDIGSVGAAGSDSYNSATGVYTLIGSGAVIGGTTDSCHYVYQTLTGDGEMEARIVSMTNTNYYARAGIMIRQSTAGNDIGLSMTESPSAGLNLIARTAVAGTATVAQTYSHAAPYWVKVVKDGSLVSYYQSPDGINWTFEGVLSFTWSGPVDLGLTVCSHVAGTLCTATFDNISFVSQTNFAPPSPWLDQDIGSPSKAGDVHWEQPLWSVFGGGAGLTGSSDQFHFAYQPLTGNGVVVAQVTALSLSGAQAGVVVRQDLTAGSAEAGVLLNATNGASFVTRATAGATLASVAGATSGISWVELVRSGNILSGYQSVDGVTWTLVGSQTITLTGTVYVGIAGTSGSSSSLALTAFNQVGLWVGADIGPYGLAGSDSYGGTNGTFTLTGSKPGITGWQDGFHYVYQPLIGDGELQARIASFSASGSPYAKVGVMLRRGVSSSGYDLFTSMVEAPGSTGRFVRRTVSSQSATTTGTVGILSWVRVVRDANIVSSYQSSDGVTWIYEGSTTYSLNDPAYIGFVVTSANNAALCTATFDNIKLTQGLLDVDGNGLPDWWEIEYFGNTGAVTGYAFTTLSPNGNGLTLLQDYSQGIDPRPSTPPPSPVIGTSTYSSPQSITLTPGAGQTLYYTVDGSNPNTSTTRISVSGSTTLSFSSTKTLQIIAVSPGYANSTITTLTITVDPNEAAFDAYNRRPKYLLRPVL